MMIARSLTPLNSSTTTRGVRRRQRLVPPSDDNSRGIARMSVGTVLLLLLNVAHAWLPCPSCLRQLSRQRRFATSGEWAGCFESLPTHNHAKSTSPWSRRCHCDRMDQNEQLPGFGRSVRIGEPTGTMECHDCLGDAVGFVSQHVIVSRRISFDRSGPRGKELRRAGRIISLVHGQRACADGEDRRSRMCMPAAVPARLHREEHGPDVDHPRRLQFDLPDLLVQLRVCRSPGDIFSWHRTQAPSRDSGP